MRKEIASQKSVKDKKNNMQKTKGMKVLEAHMQVKSGKTMKIASHFEPYGSTSINKRKLIDVPDESMPVKERKWLTLAALPQFEDLGKQQHPTFDSSFGLSKVELPKSLWWLDVQSLINEDVLTSQPVLDLDKSREPVWAGQYVQELYESFNRLEENNAVNAHYLKKHPSNSADKRARLINVINKFCFTALPLSTAAMFLAVYIIDKYFSCSVSPIPHTKMLQIGMAAMMIASKYEDSNRIRFKKFYETLHMVDKAITKAAFVFLELNILEVIGYSVAHPTAYTYLCRYARAGELDNHTCSIARCICERSLQEYAMLRYLPSLIAACSVSMARSICGLTAWSNTLYFYTGYTQTDLVECIQSMQNIFALETVNRARLYVVELLRNRGVTTRSYSTLCDTLCAIEMEHELIASDKRSQQVVHIDALSAVMPSTCGFGAFGPMSSTVDAAGTTVLAAAYTQHARLHSSAQQSVSESALEYHRMLPHIFEVYADKYLQKDDNSGSYNKTSAEIAELVNKSENVLMSVEEVDSSKPVELSIIYQRCSSESSWSLPSAAFQPTASLLSRDASTFQMAPEIVTMEMSPHQWVEHIGSGDDTSTAGHNTSYTTHYIRSVSSSVREKIDILLSDTSGIPMMYDAVHTRFSDIYELLITCPPMNTSSK